MHLQVMEPEIEDTCSEIWQARKCKSGEVIYYHNPVNGQDRWTISEVCADEVGMIHTCILIFTHSIIR